MEKPTFRILSLTISFLCIALPNIVISGSNNIQNDTVSLMQCKDPRPEMCIGQYKPVCAIKDAGVKCMTSSCLLSQGITYANGCEACSDKAVVEYKLGACKE